MTETLLWEAWEDYDAVTACKTIYVLGEVEIENSKFMPVLRKKDLPGLPTTNLILEVVATKVPTKRKIQELIYSEEICDRKNYSTITIFEGNKVIAEITELEKIATA
jgi:hypothetical protein